jgi:hypothetical protein
MFILAYLCPYKTLYLHVYTYTHRYKPLFVAVYVDGVAAVSANGKSLLYFEQRRDKASPTIEGAAADDITDAVAQQLDADDQLLHNGRQVRT